MGKTAGSFQHSLRPARRQQLRSWTKPTDTVQTQPYRSEMPFTRQHYKKFTASNEYKEELECLSVHSENTFGKIYEDDAPAPKKV